MKSFELKLGVPILYTYNYMCIELTEILEIIWTKISVYR